MDNKVAQYQRAVTPTLETGGLANTTGVLRGKILTYSSNPSNGNTSNVANQTNRLRNLQINSQNNTYRTSTMSPRANPSDMSISNKVSTSSSNQPPLNGAAGMGIATFGKNILQSSSAKYNSNGENTSSVLDQYVLPRFDLVPVNDEIPPDGIIFSRIRGNPDSLVIFRTPEERLRNPERLNLDRRSLEFCPILEQEHRLRLLNYQNNHIKYISNLENLPNLIFLDLYNNLIVSLDGPLINMKGLRVLMAGKNKISKIHNLENLKKLDVLDLHSNEIRVIEGLEHLSDLRVLNLAGNRITQVNSLSTLVSLTELNLRRNNITVIEGLDKLPSLQRVFLSHNAIEYLYNIHCIFQITYLIELSMDGNPVAEHDPLKYRNQVISHIPSLKHLDLKRITDDERSLAIKSLNNFQLIPQLALYRDDENPLNPSESANNLTARTATSENLMISSTSHRELRTSSSFTNGLPLEENNGNKKSSLLDLPMGGDFVLPDPILTSSSNAVGTKSAQSIPPLQNSIKDSLLKSNSDDENLANNTNNNTNGLTNTNNGGNSAAASSVHLGGLVALAKSGRISKAQNLFDVEIINNDEKAIIAIGDNWDWSVPKRLLPTITEVYLVHMRKETILQKFNQTQLNLLSNLKRLYFISNEFSSLKQVEFIPFIYGSVVEHVTIKDNPIISSAYGLVKAYIIANMPKLKSFNEETFQPQEKAEMIKHYQHFFSFIQKSELPNKSFIQGMKTFQRAGDINSTPIGASASEDPGNDSNSLTAMSGLNTSSMKKRMFGNANSTSNSNAVSPLSSMKQKNLMKGPFVSAINYQQFSQHATFDQFSVEFDKALKEIIVGALQSCKAAEDHPSKTSGKSSK